MVNSSNFQNFHSKSAFQSVCNICVFEPRRFELKYMKKDPRGFETSEGLHLLYASSAATPEDSSSF